MLWKKIKHIPLPSSHYPWMYSHFTNAHVILLNNSLWRIYCNTRDKNNHAYIIYVDLNAEEDFSIVNIAQKPLLELGPIGAFDDTGMSLGCIVSRQDQDYLFYLGWNLGVNVPFRNSIGLAISPKAENQFKKISLGPLMDRDLLDPFCLSYPFIIYHNNIYKMWYGSHSQWGKSTSDMLHSIKYAESTNLIHWDKKNIICLQANQQDYAFSKPCIIYENNKYRMWYTFRGDKYKIGYAESENGLEWQRLDHLAGISTSQAGWDSEMIGYPFIFDYQQNRYLIYNGNHYGKTGLGIAILENDHM